MLALPSISLYVLFFLCSHQNVCESAREDDGLSGGISRSLFRPVDGAVYQRIGAAGGGAAAERGSISTGRTEVVRGAE